MTDLSIYGGNNKKTLTSSTVGRLDYTLVGGMGTVASGETYKIGAIPANSLITSVTVVVTTGFGSDGTTDSSVNIGTTAGGSDLGNDVAITSAGVTAKAINSFSVSTLGLYITPTLTGTTTAGDLKVVVEFVETEAYMATFTE